MEEILTKFNELLDKIGITSPNARIACLAIAIFVALLAVFGVLYLVLKLILLPFRCKKFRYFMAMLFAVADAVLFYLRLNEQQDAPLSERFLLFELPSIIAIVITGFYFVCYWKSNINEVDKKNVMVVGTTGKTTKLSKSYFDSALSGQVLGFSKRIVYMIESLAFFGIGLVVGVCKTALVNAVAREVKLEGDFNSEMLAKLVYIVVCAVAAAAAFGRLVKKNKKA